MTGAGFYDRITASFDRVLGTGDLTVAFLLYGRINNAEETNHQ